ncbi:MAG: NADH-quinone oxidoreductase subunit G [Nitriliruptoraceae bacterium]
MSASETPVEHVTLTIDGTEVTVPAGTLIIRAAEQYGTIIPRFCDHPLLDPVGACRQCIVEVEGAPKPMMACTTPVAQDMVVKTHLTSPMARKGQEGTLEFLLMNHPLDCPMCDKGGECPLQDQALTHGSNTSRFIEPKRRYDKPVAISQQILLDRERCVLCARCTRFAEQIPGDPFIELLERGALEQVAIYENEPFQSYFSGNIIQICPVGALTSTSYRFKARPFDVVTTASVCDHCSAGCNLTIQSRRGEVQRQMARTNMAVNEAWNCDKGRFGFAHLTASTRLTAPAARRDGELVDTDWADALRAASTAIRTAKDAGGRVAVLTGGRLADEDAFLTSKYARVVLGTDDIDWRTRFAGDDEMAALAALAGRDGATYGDIDTADTIVVAGLDSEEEVPILHLRIRKAWRNNTARVIVVGPHAGTLAPLAYRHVQTPVGGEAGALETLADAGLQAPVVLVGERAGPGAIAAGAALATSSGGRFAYVPRRANARGAIDAGLVAGLLPGGRLLADAGDRAEVEAVWGPLPAEAGRDTRAILAAAAAGEIDVLHLIGVDPIRDAASTDLARAALAKVGTVIVQDLARTDTVTEFADVVLPATARQERDGTATNFEGRAQPFAHAVDAPGLARDDWEIVRHLAALLGHDLGVDDLAAIRAERSRLARRASAHAFPTPQPTEPAVGDGMAAEIRPMLLDDGTMLTGADDLRATARKAAVLIAPADADHLGVTDGDHVAVRGASATMTLPARLRSDVLAGTVVVPAHADGVHAGALADADGAVTITVTTVPTAEVA